MNVKRYAGIIYNDVVSGNGVCVSLYLQGCPIHCDGCHNPGTWDFNGGMVLPDDYKSMLSKAITSNGIERNFSLLGGEPLCEENLDLSLEILSYIRKEFPVIEISLWTGYKYEDLARRCDVRINSIFGNIDVLVDGKFIEIQRDTSLKMRGSKNQRIIDMKETLKSGSIVLKKYKD